MGGTLSPANTRPDSAGSEGLAFNAGLVSTPAGLDRNSLAGGLKSELGRARHNLIGHELIWTNGQHPSTGATGVLGAARDNQITLSVIHIPLPFRLAGYVMSIIAAGTAGRIRFFLYRITYPYGDAQLPVLRLVRKSITPILAGAIDEAFEAQLSGNRQVVLPPGMYAPGYVIEWDTAGAAPQIKVGQNNGRPCNWVVRTDLGDIDTQPNMLAMSALTSNTTGLFGLATRRGLSLTDFI